MTLQEVIEAIKNSRFLGDVVTPQEVKEWLLEKLGDWGEDEEVPEEVLGELFDYLQERIREKEVVYYSNAIEFLAENDPSLTEALELAYDLGYECKDLNSEILATILFQEKALEELQEIF